MIEKYPELIDTRLKLHPAGETLRQAGTQRLFRFFEKLDLPDRGVVSEDLSFCIRWRECGGQVWAAIGHRISHVGPHDFGARYLDQIEKPQEMKALTPMSPEQLAAVRPVEVMNDGRPLQAAE